MAELIQASAPSTTGTVALTGTTAGSVLVLVSRQESNSRQLLSVADTQSDAWAVAQAGNNPDLAHGVGSAYCLSAKGGNITVTPTWDVAPTSSTLVLLEYKGPALALDINVSIDNGTGATTITIGPKTPAQDIELHVSYGFGQILNREVEAPSSPAFVTDVAAADLGSGANNLIVASFGQTTNPGAESLVWSSDNGTTNQNFVIGWISFTRPQVPTTPNTGGRVRYPTALMDAAA